MWYKCWNVFLQGGWTVFNQLPLLFAVSGIVIYLHNRFFDTELPEWLGSFSGSTFVFMIGFFVMIPVAVLACAFWPKVQLGITAFQGFVKSAGAIGIFVFNFLERALIPFGLHHLLYSPFYYLVDYMLTGQNYYHRSQYLQHSKTREKEKIIF